MRWLRLGLVVLVLLPAMALATEYGPPQPLEQRSPGGRYVFRTEPKWWRQATIGSETDVYGPTLGILSRVEADGSETVVWRRTLVNVFSPLSARVTDDGNRVVTFSDWPGGGIGSASAVVIYGERGQTIRQFSLVDLLGEEVLARCPRYWPMSYQWERQIWIDSTSGVVLVETVPGPVRALELGDGTVRPATSSDLLALVRSGPPAGALDLAGRHVPHEVAPLAREVLESAEPGQPLRVEAAVALARAGDPRGRGLIEAEPEGLAALPLVAGRDALPRLVAALKGPQQAAAVEGLEILIRSADPGAVAAVLELRCADSRLLVELARSAGPDHASEMLRLLRRGRGEVLPYFERIRHPDSIPDLLQRGSDAARALAFQTGVDLGPHPDLWAAWVRGDRKAVRGLSAHSAEGLLQPGNGDLLGDGLSCFPRLLRTLDFTGEVYPAANLRGRFTEDGSRLVIWRFEPTSRWTAQSVEGQPAGSGQLAEGFALQGVQVTSVFECSWRDSRRLLQVSDGWTGPWIETPTPAFVAMDGLNGRLFTIEHGRLEGWDGRTGRRLYRVEVGVPVLGSEVWAKRDQEAPYAHPLRLSGDGLRLAVAARGEVMVLEASTGTVVRRVPGDCLVVATSWDGQVLALDTGRRMEVRGTGLSWSIDRPLPWATLTPDGSAVVEESRPLRIHQPAGMTELAGTRGFRVSRDSKVLAADCDDGAVRLWDLRTLQPLCPPLYHPEGLAQQVLDFSPDSTLLATLAGSKVRLWNLSTLGQPVELPADPEERLAFAERWLGLSLRPTHRAVDR